LRALCFYASRAAFSRRVLAPRVHVFVDCVSSLKLLCYLCYANRVDREEGVNARDRWYGGHVVSPVMTGSVPDREGSRLSVWWRAPFGVHLYGKGRRRGCEGFR
jgi:hypothetical protein